MKPYIARKLVEFAASLLILIPCVLLLAWESHNPEVAGSSPVSATRKS